MTEPLIVRVLRCDDWQQALRIVWSETFAAAAAGMGIPSNVANVQIALGSVPS